MDLYCLFHRDDDVLRNTVTGTFCSVKSEKKDLNKQRNTYVKLKYCKKICKLSSSNVVVLYTLWRVPLLLSFNTF